MTYKLNEVELMCIASNPSMYNEVVVAMAIEILTVKQKIKAFLRAECDAIDDIGMDDEQFGLMYASSVIEEKFNLFGDKLLKFKVVAYNGTTEIVSCESAGDVAAEFSMKTGLYIQDIRSIEAV